MNFLSKRVLFESQDSDSLLAGNRESQGGTLGISGTWQCSISHRGGDFFIYCIYPLTFISSTLLGIYVSPNTNVFSMLWQNCINTEWATASAPSGGAAPARAESSNSAEWGTLRFLRTEDAPFPLVGWLRVHFRYSGFWCSPEGFAFSAKHPLLVSYCWWMSTQHSVSLHTSPLWFSSLQEMELNSHPLSIGWAHDRPLTARMWEMWQYVIFEMR